MTGIIIGVIVGVWGMVSGKSDVAKLAMGPRALPSQKIFKVSGLNLRFSACWAN